MLAILAKSIVLIGSLSIFSGILVTTMTIAGYMFFRPLIQPFAWLQFKLFAYPIALPFSAVVILLGLIFPIIKRNWSITVEKSGFLGLFIFISILSVGLSDNYTASVSAIIKLLTVWFLYNIAYNSVRNRKEAIYIIDALIVSSIIPLSIGLYQAITGNYDFMADAEVDRISSVFGTGNDYGIYLTFVTATTAIRLVITNTRNVRILLLILLTIVLVSQVLSLNRGTWLALSFGFIISAVKYRKYLNYRYLVIGGIIFLLVFSGKIAQRFNELKDPGSVHYSETSTLEGRINYWFALLPIIMERPIQGYGIGSGTFVTQKYFGKQHRPHNDYVTLFLETGIFGVIFYMAFLGKIFFYFFFRRVVDELWIWNFAMLMLSTYFIIISGVQNIVQSILNLPFYLILVAVVLKLNRISNTKGKTSRKKMIT